MKITSIIAIYALFWVLAAFLVLPFDLRTHDEAGSEAERGHAASAPVNFRPGRVLKRTTLLALVLFALYYANYVAGWITVDDLNFFGQPPQVTS